MSIVVRMVGQFGNQVLTHVLCKILAERTGLAYRAPKCFIDKQRRPVQWSGSPIFQLESSEGRATDRLPQVIDCLHWFDMASLDRDRMIIVRQWFGQRYEFLQPWKEKIQRYWLRFMVPLPVQDVDRDAIYVHVRRTDYVFLDEASGVRPDPAQNGTATTLEEYARCFAEFPDAKRCVLVTDNAADPFLDDLIRTAEDCSLSATVQSLAWDLDFLTLAAARFVVISQSTYSWLAAWLGMAEKIVCPCFPGTFWHHGMGLHGAPGPGEHDYPNLYPDDESERWTWITG